MWPFKKAETKIESPIIKQDDGIELKYYRCKHPHFSVTGNNSIGYMTCVICLQQINMLRYLDTLSNPKFCAFIRAKEFE